MIDFSAKHLKVIELATVALAYYCLAKVSQSLAIPPGNVTPLWLPSGVMFAWAWIRGGYIWPGIVLGAFVGNAWAYFDISSFSAASSTVLGGLFNGFGDALGIVGAVWLIKKRARIDLLFSSYQSIVWFLGFAVIGSSTISAVFGVSGLWIAGIIDQNLIGEVFFTWFTGDTVGILAIVPPIYAIAYRNKAEINERRSIEAILLVLFLSALCLLTLFLPSSHPFYGFILFPILPALIWSSIRLNRTQVTLLLLYVSCLSLTGTLLGLGPFAFGAMNQALIHNQLFIATLYVSILFLYAARVQAQIAARALFLANQNLKDANQNLEHTVRERTQELEQEKEHAEKLASIDALTGINNRRSFDERANREISLSKRTKAPIALIMFDIDHFKRVNDTFGHPKGDVVLKNLAQVTSAQLRDHDLLARIGGEEFAVLLPHTTLEVASQLSERLRKTLEKQSVSEENVTYTASFGVCSVDPTSTDISEALKIADKALYEAKNSGRNKTVTADNSAGKSRA